MHGTLDRLVAKCEKLGVELIVYDENDPTVKAIRERTKWDGTGTFLLLTLNQEAVSVEVFSEVFKAFYSDGYWLSLLPGTEEEDDKRMLCVASSLKAGARKPDESSYGGRFAVRLRKLRDESGLSVEDIVERIQKFNQSSRKSPKVAAFYGWEQGSACPHLELLPAIAEALQIKVRDLLPEN